MSTGPDPSGLDYVGDNVDRLRRRVDAQRRENGRRLICPHCDLTIAPETFARHLELVHGREAQG